MSVTSIHPAGGFNLQQTKEPVEQVHARQLQVQDLPDTEKSQRQLNSEELLKQIKKLAEGGSYSVQFEMNKDTESLVVRVVDRQSGKVVRQIPSEELLKTIKALKDLRGLIVDTER
ncbi:MAG: flagellar protein FlaG [Deltaproteobacteria bacterium]|nr:MAG: flagellar protein FlaG [Deltaproteobacteria bacterium]